MTNSTFSLIIHPDAIGTFKPVQCLPLMTWRADMWKSSDEQPLVPNLQCSSHFPDCNVGSLLFFAGYSLLFPPLCIFFSFSPHMRLCVTLTIFTSRPHFSSDPQLPLTPFFYSNSFYFLRLFSLRLISTLMLPRSQELQRLSLL